jgi:hypothetical protein
MKKGKKNQEQVIRFVEIQVSNKRDKELLEKAFALLDKLGYTIAKKSDLVLEPEK